MRSLSSEGQKSIYDEPSKQITNTMEMELTDPTHVNKLFTYFVGWSKVWAQRGGGQQHVGCRQQAGSAVCGQAWDGAGADVAHPSLLGRSGQLPPQPVQLQPTEAQGRNSKRRRDYTGLVPPAKDIVAALQRQASLHQEPKNVAQDLLVLSQLVEKVQENATAHTPRGRAGIRWESLFWLTKLDCRRQEWEKKCVGFNHCSDWHNIYVSRVFSHQVPHTKWWN